MDEEDTNEYNRLSGELTDGPVRQEDNQMEAEGNQINRPEVNYAESTSLGGTEYHRGSVYSDESLLVGNSRSNHEIRISQLNSGYLVNVGCQSAAVETTEALLKVLGEYLNDPSGFEAKWNRNPNRNKLS